LPLYEYKCVKCGHRFEKIESLGASETKKCPKCGAKAERQIAAPAIQFKGSGWYVTDYAGKSAAASSGDSGGESASGKDGEKSSDSKKETKTETKTAAASESSDKGAANRKKK
jgi:putative FmdB family regulatory protein